MSERHETTRAQQAISGALIAAGDPRLPATAGSKKLGWHCCCCWEVLIPECGSTAGKSKASPVVAKLDRHKFAAAAGDVRGHGERD